MVPGRSKAERAGTLQLRLQLPGRGEGLKGKLASNVISDAFVMRPPWESKRTGFGELLDRWTAHGGSWRRAHLGRAWGCLIRSPVIPICVYLEFIAVPCNILFNEPINASVSVRSESYCSTLIKNPRRGCGNPHSQLPGQKHRWDSVGLGSAVHGGGGECLGD